MKNLEPVMEPSNRVVWWREDERVARRAGVAADGSGGIGGQCFGGARELPFRLSKWSRIFLMTLCSVIKPMTRRVPPH